jgi:hypothetical protein
MEQLQEKNRELLECLKKIQKLFEVSVITPQRKKAAWHEIEAIRIKHEGKKSIN